MAASDRWVLVGNPDPEHIGASFRTAAIQLKLEVQFADSRKAFGGYPLIEKLNWWVAGHRPPRLHPFSRSVVELCKSFRPQGLLATGVAPLEKGALEAMGKMGIRRVNYLTDDPWNPVHRAPWFLKALSQYDYVFSPRRSNLEDLRRAGVLRADFLPFAYEPARYFPEEPATREEKAHYESEILFYGGADPDRLRYIVPLIRQGFRVHLYGGYWDRTAETRTAFRGHADARMIRQAVHGARVCLGLVRKANRDGNAMRSFEIPAMKGCMLTENTLEHREIFGKDGEAVVYFQTPEEMLQKLRWLLKHPEDCQRLAENAHRLILDGGHTYQDRLKAILRDRKSG